MEYGLTSSTIKRIKLLNVNKGEEMDYGDGHGKDAKTFKPLDQSYSRLIVYTCINYVQFLLDIDENN